MKKLVAIILSLICVVSVCFAIPASAEEFAPSAALADTPDVLPPDDLDAEKVPDDMKAEDVVAVINGGEDPVFVSVEDLIQISISEAKNSLNSEDKNVAALSKALVDAFTALKNHKDGVKSEKNIVKAAEDLGIKNPEMNVTEIFEVNLGEAANEALNKDGTSVVLRFENKSNAVQGKLIVAHMVGNEWKAIAKDKVTVTKDAIKVEFDSLCPVMFISVAEGKAPVASEEETDAPKTETNAPTNTPTTPAEEDNNIDTIITVVIIVVAVAGVIIAVYLLYKNGKFDSITKSGKNKIVHPERSQYKKSKKAKKWSGKKKIRRQKRRNRK